MTGKENIQTTNDPVIHVDFLFARLCRDVSRWYDENYMGKDKELKKNIHLTVLQHKYETRTDEFSTDPVIKQKEVELFLTMVQRSVDGYAS